MAPTDWAGVTEVAGFKVTVRGATAPAVPDDTATGAAALVAGGLATLGVAVAVSPPLVAWVDTAAPPVAWAVTAEVAGGLVVVGVGGAVSLTIVVAAAVAWATRFGGSGL
jgi:hypothetical protein